MAMTVVTRFAPSPTGRLHVGNIRTALLSALFTQRHGGRFVLRIDDTDAERSEERYVEAIRDDLAWLGLATDSEVRQSQRFDRYEARFQALVDDGRIYPAYETAQELDLKRKIQLGRGLPPIYDRAALALSDADQAKLEADGVRPHWRFKLDRDAAIFWDDLIRGPQSFDPATMSDPVIRRADGSWLYMLPSAIDDLELGITHVVRGEDHVSNTALQLQMFAAMRAPARFDEAELEQLNAKVVHQLDFDAVAGRLPAGMDRAGWEAIRPNVANIAQAADWWQIVTGPIQNADNAEDRDFLTQAAAVAAEIDWSADPWHALTGALKAATGRGGKALFLPLRRALTGRDHGPDMAALLPLIGRDEAIRRLSA